MLIRKGALPNFRANQWAPIHVAVQLNHIDVVKALLEGHALVNLKGAYGWSPMQLACQGGFTELAKVLIENSADVNHIDQYNMTPLFITCIRGRLEVARCLIDNGASVNWTTPDRNCALRHASRRGHRDLVRLLLSRGSNIEAARENEDKTGLCKVIMRGLEAKRNKEAIPSNVLSLFSSTERRAIQELALIFVLRLPVYTNKSLQIVKEYMTYNGLFMGDGFEMGIGGLWNGGGS